MNERAGATRMSRSGVTSSSADGSDGGVSSRPMASTKARSPCTATDRGPIVPVMGRGAAGGAGTSGAGRLAGSTIRRIVASRPLRPGRQDRLVRPARGVRQVRRDALRGAPVEGAGRRLQGGPSMLDEGAPVVVGRDPGEEGHDVGGLAHLGQLERRGQRVVRGGVAGPYDGHRRARGEGLDGDGGPMQDDQVGPGQERVQRLAVGDRHPLGRRRRGDALADVVPTAVAGMELDDEPPARVTGRPRPGAGRRWPRCGPARWG